VGLVDPDPWGGIARGREASPPRTGPWHTPLAQGGTPQIMSCGPRGGEPSPPYPPQKPLGGDTLPPTGVSIYIYIYIYIYILYPIEKKSPCDVKITLRRDLATNLATEPCDNLATYLATDTLRRGDVCGENLATDVATETLRRTTMCQMAVLCFNVMFHSMFHSFLATKTLKHLATGKGKIKTCSEIL